MHADSTTRCRNSRGRRLASSTRRFGPLQFLAGASIGGLWLVFIGWFILSAARAEEAAAVTRRALDGVRVRDVMSADPRVAPGWITVDAFIERYLFGSPHSAYPVEGFGGGIVGLMTLAELRAVPNDARAATRVLDVAIPLANVATATPDEPLVSLLERLDEPSRGRALVFEGAALVGDV